MQAVDPALLAELDPASRIYPEKGSRNRPRSKDGRKAHGKGHHHKEHKKPEASTEKPKRRRRRRRPKSPQSGGEQS
jgi:ATP-dependent RNA helicase RhlB